MPFLRIHELQTQIRRLVMFRYEPKGIARRGDENGRDRARISTKIFFLSLEVPHVNEPVV